ncbi:hypothetical protein IFM89_033340 [Coptis chinensis]|uniref:Retrotransposon gag domain-containing protein n=1 Tax=Coptis chinensis TaxID=261450 RepID=A0A835HGX8_9MAGN|nr:hypothetical protein IFM89_033340 [Coptis chinensis]
MKYRSSMALFNNNDALMCIMFQATLSGEALTWFNELRPRSIHTFSQLADKFSKHYHYNRKTIKGSGTLFNLHIEKGESIRDFRFEDLLVRAKRYATVQEDSKYKQQKDFSSDRGKQEQQQCDKDRKKHNKDAKIGISQSQKQDGHPSKDLTLPELSVSLSELYDKLKGKLSKPFLMKPDTEGRRDKSKKCKYHNDFSHTMNDCYAFKKEISKMAAVCSSNRERKWSMKRKIQKIGSWNHVNIINFKSGFYAETIVERGLTFTEEDERGVYYPHNDVVVITTWVGIRRVQRILIDTGSSACILFSGCYSVMNLDEDLIQEDDTPIIGFNVYVVNTRRRKREQADRASSESKDLVDAEDRQTLASLRKQLKRKHPTVNNLDQGINPDNLGSIGGDHENTVGDIIPTENEKSESEVESEEETLDDLEIRDLEILALEKSDWRLPFIGYLNSRNLPT